MGAYLYHLLLSALETIIKSWVPDNLTGAEVLAVSQMGYVSKSIAVAWLDHFIKHDDSGPDSHWHILLLDGYITHCQNHIVIKCHENKIVPIALP